MFDDRWIILPLVALVFAAMIVPNVRAMGESPDDTTAIKAALEGDGRRVVSIKKIGMQMGGRASSPLRRYLVVVEDQVYGQSTATVEVTVPLFGMGEVSATFAPRGDPPRI